MGLGLPIFPTFLFKVFNKYKIMFRFVLTFVHLCVVGRSVCQLPILFNFFWFQIIRPYWGNIWAVWLTEEDLIRSWTGDMTSCCALRWYCGQTAVSHLSRTHPKCWSKLMLYCTCVSSVWSTTLSLHRFVINWGRSHYESLLWWGHVVRVKS